jgi:hypothetical protein
MKRFGQLVKSLAPLVRNMEILKLLILVLLFNGGAEESDAKCMAIQNKYLMLLRNSIDFAVGRGVLHVCVMSTFLTGLYHRLMVTILILNKILTEGVQNNLPVMLIHLTTTLYRMLQKSLNSFARSYLGSPFGLQK